VWWGREGGGGEEKGLAGELSISVPWAHQSPLNCAASGTRCLPHKESGYLETQSIKSQLKSSQM